MAPRSIALLCNNAAAVGPFRGPLVCELVRRGSRVFVFAPDYDAATRALVAGLGAEPVDFRMERTGTNPARDLLVIIGLARRLRALRVDACLGFMTKLVIYGALAGFLARVPRRCGMVEGLGYFFTVGGRGWRKTIVRTVITVLYRLSLPRLRTLFALNPDDARVLAGFGARRVVVLDGVGIDTGDYPAAPLPDGPPGFLMVGRLLAEKGVRDFAAAADLVRRDFPDARFTLVGPEDSNPGGIAGDEARQWVARGTLEWPGPVADTRPWYRAATVYVLPSYREGMPRTVLEALATERPVITTDAPGCRETIAGAGAPGPDRVRVGENGLLVPVGDARALAAAMRRFLREPALAARMGAAGRRLAVERFDVRTVNARVLEELER
ncbi:glycosyltransferase family 4 protein [candidate division WOR-3 bacterium]|nr:glycosyltransferase family 4 protein [candidate division WOR-3 bacterium]